jgi:FMN reductase
VGNPRAGSKTLAATRALVDTLAEAVSGTALPVVDLADFGGRVLDYSDGGVAALRAELATVNLLVVATPVYKGSYTGLLKAFLDGYGPGALASVYTVPFTIAASPQHALAGPTHLQPLLDELGAISPLGGLFLPDGVVAEPAERDTRIAAWLAPRVPLLTAITEVSA